MRLLVLLLLGLGLPVWATRAPVHSPLLGVPLPGRLPTTLERLDLESALKRVASLARFSCDPGALEVYRLEGPLGEEERQALERGLGEAGWRFSPTRIGTTRLWSLEREVFGRKSRVLLVEAREGERAFLGVCLSLY